MTELLNSYTFEAKKIVYYSVTVGADNKTEAKRIASEIDDFEPHYIIDDKELSIYLGD